MRIFPRLKRFEWLLLLFLVGVYLVLTLTNLTKLPIFVDEALYLRWAQIAWHDASWRFISLTDGKQPLYIWFVIPFMKFISDPLVAGRTASVIAGLASVLGMGYLGWLVKDKRLGFFAMLLTVFSPYLFFYARFGVMESLLTASGIVVICLSILLARYNRLDLALILGMTTGAALLVKSSAMFFALVTPIPYLFTLTSRTIFSKKTVKYLLLLGIAWGVACVIYNVQRLSPWMHMIGEKNSFFIVSYSEIFADPKRLWNNFLDIWRWQGAYTTWPLIATALAGLIILAKSSVRTALTALAWFLVPVIGTVAVARLFAPRYIVFATPYLLLLAAYFLSRLKGKTVIILTPLLLLLPAYLILRLHLDPIHFPYTSVDEGYVNGWSAGNGTRQVADWAVARIKETGKPMTIFTEGTFGILPHGLELFTDGRVQGLTIIGLYPINEIPPSRTVEAASVNKETYLLLNNTKTADMLGGLELIAKYEKRDPPYSMRLYRVLPKGL